MDPTSFADSTGATRVVDPVLTTVARGYRHAMHVFNMLFPIVTVYQRGGNIITFGAEDFVKRDLHRAPGARRPVLEVGYSAETFAVRQRAIDGTVSIERMQEANAVPGIQLGRVAATRAMNAASLQVELQSSGMATDPVRYPAGNVTVLVGGAQWSHADSRPAAAVKRAKNSIRIGVGMEPNTLVIGPEVFDALQENPDVIDRVKHTRGPSDDPINEQLLAGYFGVERVAVGSQRWGEPGNFQAVWGKHAVLAFSGVSSLDSAEADMGSPSFGYTYRLDGYPMIGEPWFDRDRDSWRYPATCEDEPVIAGPAAGYLFQNAVQ